MANASKNKGDRGEREAISVLRELVGDLLLDGNDRARSAGIPKDRGDLYALADVAIQVKHPAASRLGTELLAAAHTSVDQAANGYKPLALGMVSIHGARRTGVRWLAAMIPAQAEALGLTPVADFKTISKLREWIGDDIGPHGFLAYERSNRVGSFCVGARSIIVAPIEAWTHAYRRYLGRPAAA